MPKSTPTESTQSGLPENKRHTPGREQPEKQNRSPSGTTTQDSETTHDQERGERIATGKTIARGGKTTGHVPGASEQK
jgi:hypothetical protein